MTPLDKAKQLIVDMNTYAVASGYSLPITQYTQVGEAVIDCESLIAAVILTVPHVDYGPIDCNASQNSTFAIYMTRACSWTAYQDGTTNPSALQAASEQVDLDGQFMWDFALQYDSYLSKSWTLQYSFLDAGLGVSRLQLTIGVD